MILKFQFIISLFQPIYMGSCFNCYINFMKTHIQHVYKVLIFNMFTRLTVVFIFSTLVHVEYLLFFKRKYLFPI